MTGQVDIAVAFDDFLGIGGEPLLAGISNEFARYCKQNGLEYGKHAKLLVREFNKALKDSDRANAEARIMGEPEPAMPDALKKAAGVIVPTALLKAVAEPKAKPPVADGLPKAKPTAKPKPSNRAAHEPSEGEDENESLPAMLARKDTTSTGLIISVQSLRGRVDVKGLIIEPGKPVKVKDTPEIRRAVEVGILAIV